MLLSVIPECLYRESTPFFVLTGAIKYEGFLQSQNPLHFFFVILSGAKNLLFLRIREVDPSSLGRALLRVTGMVIPECLYRESTSLLLQEHEMSIGASY